MVPNSNLSSYDEVPYESFSFVQTHPERMAVNATLLGLMPARPTSCRVLELGCAAGGNLVPMAVSLPFSTFVGIDLSLVQIKQGQRLIDQLGLRNVEIHHRNIIDITEDLGRFDYIVCHGVFSWVPASVQDKIFSVCKANLAPNGIAYISYNTYPGWHMRGLIRGILAYHAKQFREPAMRIRQARNFLDFLAKSVGGENTPYSMLLQAELESFQRSSDAYLYHEHLEEDNEPIFFHQFAERAAAKGLRYLADTELGSMVPGNYPPEVANVLQMMAQDLIHMEQYMDFLRNRVFRQSLLCHDQLKPTYQIRGERMRSLHVASHLQFIAPRHAALKNPNETIQAFNSRGTSVISASSEAAAEADFVHFSSPDGLTVASRDPLVHAALGHLIEIWPAAIPFDQLVETARLRVACGKQPDPATLQSHTEVLGQAFLKFYLSASTGLVELYLDPPHVAVKASARPTASPLARIQAASHSWVTSVCHKTVTLGDFARCLIQRLDGQSDRTALAHAMRNLVANGELTLAEGGKPVTEGRLVAVVSETIDGLLTQFAENRLLIG